MFTAFALVVALHGPVTNDQHGHGNSAHPPASTHGAASHPTPSNNSSAPKHTTTTTTGKTTTSTAALTPVQQKVQSHTQLAGKLQSRLPPGTDVIAAAKGFRNFGQFVAAVNVSHNLGIPFTQLKADMVRRHMSLGQSIQDLRPSANSTVEVRRGETEAKKMIGSGE
jgi:hypothetical protein